MDGFGGSPTIPKSGGENAPAEAARPVRVLIVEDQVLIALSLLADLAAMGCAVVGRVATGEHAIDVARRVDPDIVLMDVHLGRGIDGIEAATRIGEFSNARIVFITAYAEGPDRKRMDALNPAGILGKPYEAEDLARLVAADGGGAGEPRWRAGLASAA